ncbi:MAG: phosphatidate cytidylyltransferase [Treponema sp.]|jgi:dolichol kinase|nr:phosphatidate cytidylyltransferase [Treponema sp.]
MTKVITNLKSLRTELVRKSIHFLIALSPVMAMFNRPFTVIFLMMGVLSYILMESLRLKGVSIPLISSLTAQASRPRDEGRFVLGPVTLGLGALLVLMFFSIQTATIAIFALAFGDGFASLVGKPFGRIRPAFMCGKSVEGSLACFFAVFISAWSVSHNLIISLAAAFTATLVEALPLQDFDNMAIPFAVALLVSLI